MSSWAWAALACTRARPHCVDKSSRVVILRTFRECVSQGNNASLYFLTSYGGSRSKRLKEALMYDPSVRKVFSEHWGAASVAFLQPNGQSAADLCARWQHAMAFPSSHLTSPLHKIIISQKLMDDAHAALLPESSEERREVNAAES